MTTVRRRGSLIWGSEYDMWEWQDEHFALAYGLQSALNKLDPGKHARPSEKLINATKEAFPQHALAMDTGETGFGAELIASETLASIWRQARLESLVFKPIQFSFRCRLRLRLYQ